MTSRLAVLVIDALEPPRIAEFWCEVLGWQVAAVDDADMSIGPADGTSPTIDVCRVRKRKKGKDWLHLDLRAAGVPTEVELPRLLDLGATRVDVGRSNDATWLVLADPEGHESCLLSRSAQELPEEGRDPADRG